MGIGDPSTDFTQQLDWEQASVSAGRSGRLDGVRPVQANRYAARETRFVRHFVGSRP